MKKELIILLFVLSISGVLAIPELSIPSAVQPGEILLGQITGNFARSLSIADLLFYEGERQIFIESDIIFYNGTYYFYAYPVKQGNFTLNVNNVLYRAPELKSVNLEKNFEVKEIQNKKDNSTFTEILSIHPGFILTSSSAKLTLSNKGNSSIDVGYSFENITQKLNISSGDFTEISIYPRKEFSILSVNAYSKFDIPIIFTNLRNESTYTAKDLSVFPSFLKINLNKNQSLSKELVFANPDESEISNFSMFQNTNIISGQIPSIGKNKTFSVNLSISGNTLGAFNSSLLFTYIQNNISKSITLPAEIYVFSENSPLPSNYTNSSYETPSCSSLGGNVCLTGVCSGTGTYSLEGYCCIGQCAPAKTETPGSSSGWIIGIIIVIVVGAAGFFVYKKYKSAKPAKAEDTLKEKSELYEKRISGKLTRT